MTPFKPISSAAAVMLVCAFTVAPARAGPVDWTRYMSSSAAVSAIAAALSFVEKCSVPLEFDEIQQDGKRLLTLNCNGSDEEEAAVTIEFIDYGDGALLPGRFMYAG